MDAITKSVAETIEANVAERPKKCSKTRSPESESPK
jgi:hypothetical protein